MPWPAWHLSTWVGPTIMMASRIIAAVRTCCEHLTVLDAVFSSQTAVHQSARKRKLAGKPCMQAGVMQRELIA